MYTCTSFVELLSQPCITLLPVDAILDECCRLNTRLRWTREMENLVPNQCQFLQFSKCHALISHIHPTLDILLQHMVNLMHNHHLKLKVIQLLAILLLAIHQLAILQLVIPQLAIQSDHFGQSRVGNIPSYLSLDSCKSSRLQSRNIKLYWTMCAEFFCVDSYLQTCLCGFYIGRIQLLCD